MRWLSQSAVAVGVAAVLAAAGWSLTQAPHVAAQAAPGEIALDDGLVRVDQVVSAARPQHAMPGMGTDNDPVAEGERRISIDVTLRAADDESLHYRVDRFELRVPGAQPRRPHRAVLPGDVLPEGTQLSGTLVFDVPVAATAGDLSYEGAGSTEVALPLEERQSGAGTPPDQPPAPDAGHHGHGAP